MIYLLAVLKILHVAAAAAWLGLGIGAAGRLRRGLDRGGEVADLAVDELRRGRPIILGAALLTFVTGLGMIFILGGFRAVPVYLHVALALMVLALAVELAVVQPAVKRLTSSVETSRRRIGAGLGLVHLLWLAMLTLMVVQKYA